MEFIRQQLGESVLETARSFGVGQEKTAGLSSCQQSRCRLLSVWFARTYGSSMLQVCINFVWAQSQLLAMQSAVVAARRRSHLGECARSSGAQEACVQ
jgi:hypothetical protein